MIFHLVEPLTVDFKSAGLDCAKEFTILSHTVHRMFFCRWHVPPEHLVLNYKGLDFMTMDVETELIETLKPGSN